MVGNWGSTELGRSYIGGWLIVIYTKDSMPERKAWTPEEDNILKILREEEMIAKWSAIAKKMAEDYGMPGRTGKQCRER